jgi:hypothetical protein
MVPESVHLGQESIFREGQDPTVQKSVPEASNKSQRLVVDHRATRLRSRR